MIGKKLLSILILFIFSVPARATLITPVADVSLSGGQYFLDGDSSSFGGNAAVYFSPAVNFSEENALIPLFNFNYSGTRGVEELPDGHILTRHTLSGGVRVIYVFYLGDYLTRLRLGYRQSFINETRDEDWGDGLFDNTRFLAGAEAERILGSWETSVTADYYIVGFDNYVSLASEVGEEVSPGLEDTGKDLLNYSNAAITLGGERPLERGMLDLSYRFDWRPFADQPVVKSDGTFSSSNRRDIINTLSFGFRRPLSNMVAGLSGTFAMMSSDQNSFDSDTAKFIQNYYSYTDISLSPELVSFIEVGGKRARLNFSLMLRRRYYSTREARDEEGDYIDENIYRDEGRAALSFSYPVMENLSARLGGSYTSVTSNMKYERTYRYNYSASNYFLGADFRY